MRILSAAPVVAETAPTTRGRVPATPQPTAPRSPHTAASTNIPAYFLIVNTPALVLMS